MKGHPTSNFFVWHCEICFEEQKANQKPVKRQMCLQRVQERFVKTRALILKMLLFGGKLLDIFFNRFKFKKKNKRMFDAATV